MRLQRSLAGTWQFQVDPAGTLTVDALAPTHTIPVPLPWQAAFPELQRYSGYAWYQHTVDLREEWLAGELVLHFGAVDYWCQVFVNGVLAGQHEGGYIPFRLPIRSLVRPGSNTLAVRVYDPVQTSINVARWPSYKPETSSGQPPFDANNIPHGKQEWYINVGGIWQDVQLIAVPACWLEHVAVTTDIRTGQAGVVVELGGATNLDSGTLVIEIADADGTVAAASVALEPGQRVYNVQIAVDQPQLWNVDTPCLYTATARLQTHAGADQISTRFGFREITTRNGRLLLNGEPLFLLSALDQDIYPDTIYTVPSDEFLRDQFRKAKELGLNNLRCHIKPPDPRYLDLADEMGLLVWAEIPSWRTFPLKGSVHPGQLHLDDTIKQRVEQTLTEMIRRDFNHPSLIIWTIVNEDWGTTLALSADDRAWVAHMYDRCKQLDPTRLVVDNSACLNSWGPNVHVKSDLDDFHMYTNIPDQARVWDLTIEQFGLRPLWTYASDGSAQRTGQEPLILSEFGNWGLPSLRLLREHYGGDPAWFELGPWWSRWEGEPGWPAGVAERFEKLGLTAIWPDYEAFATATQWHQFAAMKFEIETMRRQPALAGYVITELSDIYWESNGLLDFARNPKAYHDQFATINAPDMVIPQVARYAYWDDQHVTVRVHGSHYGATDWADAQLRWSCAATGSSGECAIPALPRGTAAELGVLHWRVPQVEQPRAIQVALVITGANGAILARNTLDLLVLPARNRAASYQEPIALRIGRHMPDTALLRTATLAPNSTDVTEPSSPAAPLDTVAVTDIMDGEESESRLVHAIQQIGYRADAQLTPETRVAVTNRPHAELLRWVRDGGRLLFLARGPNPFFWVQSRGAAYSGNWMTNFSWLKPDICKRLAVTNPLTLPFMNVMPTSTIVGLPYEDPSVQGDFLAGLVGGWVNHPAIHTVQFRYGQGKVLMTTFTIAKRLGSDPVATALFHDLVDYLASDACQPTLRASYAVGDLVQGS